MRHTAYRLLVLLLPALLVLSACAPSASPPTPSPQATPAPTTATTAAQTQEQAKAAAAQAQAGGTLVVVTQQKPAHLDPNVHSSRYTAMVNMNTHDPLIWQPEPNKFEPGLAEKWEVSSDWTTFTFYLRKDVKFHDGTPLTAEAVKFVWDRIKDPATRSLRVATFNNLDRIEVVDTHTIRAVFKSANPPFLQSAASTAISPQSPDAIKKLGENYLKTPSGTGPFKVEGWPNENTLVLVRNPDYTWGPKYAGKTGPAYLDKIVYKYVTEEATRTAALEKKEAHVAEDPARHQAPMFGSNKDFQLLMFKTSGLPQHWPFNYDRYPTNDITVRQAFQHAVDKKKIAEVAFFNTVTAATGPLTDTNWAYWPGVRDYYPYDVKKANALLEAKGYKLNPSTKIREKDGKPLRMRLVTTSTWEQTRSSSMAQAMVKEAGIDLVVEAMVYDATVPRYADNDYEMGRLGLSGFDPNVLWSAFHSSQITGGAQFNRARIKNPALDEILEKGRVSTNIDERKELFKQAQKMLMDDATAIFMWEDHYFFVGLSCVKGFAWEPGGSYMLHNVWLDGDCRKITG